MGAGPEPKPFNGCVNPATVRTRLHASSTWRVLTTGGTTEGVWMRRTFSALLTAVVLAVGGVMVTGAPAAAASCTRPSSTVVIPLNADKHANLIRHAQIAINRGYPVVMVLHRADATARRSAAVRSTPTKDGFDRDEYPAAVGRAVNRADIAYVRSAENRSGGAVMGNKLRAYCDGTRFTYAGTKAKSTTKPVTTPKPAPKNDPRFATCTAAKKAGYGPYRRADPEFGWYQDRDKDGVACE